MRFLRQQDLASSPVGLNLSSPEESDSASMLFKSQSNVGNFESPPQRGSRETPVRVASL